MLDLDPHKQTMIWIVILTLIWAWFVLFIPRSVSSQNINKIVGELDFGPTVEIWKANMRICESTDSQNAINEVDLDGTASHGLYQYKIDTWKGYVKKYDLWDWEEWDEADWWNTLYSRDHQLVVFSYMIQDPDVNWKREFPGCIKKLGYPPIKSY